MIKLGGLFLGLILFCTQVATAELSGIYQSENQWDWAYEEEFSNWLQDVAGDKDFFKRNNIAIDCADTIYGFRWIFARIHKLPMITTTTTLGVVSHESVHPEWRRLPTAKEWFEDKRFLAALDYILHHSWTETLADDSYPVHLGALIPGTFFLNLDASKHVDTIYKINMTDPDKLPFEFVSSSVPRQIKPSKHLVYWYEDQPKTEREGFRRFIWPVKRGGQWSHMDPTEMPYYSVEQFDLELEDQTFHTYVYDLAKPHMNLKALAQISLRELELYVQERVDIVNKGYQICHKSRSNRRKCRRESSKLYSDWSTPSRDKRIHKHLEATREEIMRAQIGVSWESLYSEVVVIEIEGRGLNLLDIHQIWEKKIYSSKPLDKPLRRWGL